MALPGAAILTPQPCPDEPDTFVRPVGKNAMGRPRQVEVDENGAIEDVAPMRHGAAGYSFFYRISGPKYHTLLIRSDFLVFHESTTGPFVRDQTAFAPWAPAEDDLAGRAMFLRGVEDSVKRFMSTRAARGQS